MKNSWRRMMSTATPAVIAPNEPDAVGFATPTLHLDPMTGGLPISIPSTWSDAVVDPQDLDWQALGARGRKNGRALQRSLATLMRIAGEWPLDRRGPDGGLVLRQALAGWEDNLHSKGPTLWQPGTGPHRVRFPLPSEAAWDGQGQVGAWQLPAALLVARGAWRRSV